MGVTACAQREGRAARRFVPAKDPPRPVEGGTRPVAHQVGRENMRLMGDILVIM